MSVAKSYAKALYEAAAETPSARSAIDSFEGQLDSFDAILSTSKDARTTLLGPATSAKEKAAIVDALSKRLEVAPLVQVFLKLLARKGRLGLLAEIREAFGSVRLEAEGGIQGKLVSADPMGAQDVESLAQAFTKKLGKRVAFRASTDPALLAGMKVTVQGVTYDGTLSSQLRRLRDQLVYGNSSVN